MVEGGKVILSREEKSFIFEPILVLKCFETISDGIPNRIPPHLSPDLCQRLGSLPLFVQSFFCLYFFLFSDVTLPEFLIHRAYFVGFPAPVSCPLPL